MSVGAASFRSVGIIGPSSMPAIGFRVIRGDGAVDALPKAGIPLPRMVTDSITGGMVFLLSETGSNGSSPELRPFHPSQCAVALAASLGEHGTNRQSAGRNTRVGS